MKVLWCPLFSMRSYETGKYAILKDGNFQLTMSRVLASNFDSVTVAVPDNSSDFDELKSRFKDDQRILFIQLKYGANAVETREKFWDFNDDFIEYFVDEFLVDVVISDITGYPGKKPIIYNFNITKLPELDRPYIDKFFEQDLASIEQSLFTTVLNPRQREYILEVRPDLIDKVIVNTKCAHESLMPRHEVASIEWARSMKKIFWPFRISDKAYKWDEFLVWFQASGLADDGYTIDITDPNDTAKHLPPFVKKLKLDKASYYAMLSNRFTVVMLDDIDTVLHPGTIEFFHYGCPVITFESKLIDNPNSIVDLNELGYAVRNVVYNVIDTQVWNFVYRTGEVDSLYNKDFVNVRSN
jgi:hypothetical protein